MNADHAELARFNALAERWWDEDSEFRPLHRINPHRLQWINGLAGLAGRQVLDVGCGGGILAEAMARRGARVDGIDLAEMPLRIARQHGVAHCPTPPRYALSSAEDWAADHRGHYDIVTCMEMLEHVPSPPQVITACAEMVKPGGWVFFSTLNRNALSYLIAIVGAEQVLRILPKGTHQHARFIKPAELLRMTNEAGLQAREQRGLLYNPFSQRFRLGGFMGVAYLMAMQRPQELDFAAAGK